MKRCVVRLIFLREIAVFVSLMQPSTLTDFLPEPGSPSDLDVPPTDGVPVEIFSRSAGE